MFIDLTLLSDRVPLAAVPAEATGAAGGAVGLTAETGKRDIPPLFLQVLYTISTASSQFIHSLQVRASNNHCNNELSYSLYKQNLHTVSTTRNGFMKSNK